MKEISIYEIALCALFIALIAVGAFIRRPTPLVPITFQYTMVMLAGMLLGPKLGAFSAFAYMVIGLMGVPIFTAGGGPSYVLKPSFGYIIGFVFAAFVVGLISHKKENPSYKMLVVSGFTGLLVCYIFGMVYCMLMMDLYLHSPMPFSKAIVSLFLIFLPGDGILTVIFAYVAKRVKPQIDKMKSK